jgi:glycosyltransferase involved in cell wall biosynthesis
VVPPGVDLDRFKRGKDLSLLKELNIDKKKTVLLYVGRLPPEKNLDRLLRELRFLERDNIKLERFYSIADIFICPSKYEPFGQVILEAMASSLPCIAFKRVLPEYEVASEEIIEDDVTGYCINPYDRNEFRQKWLYLIDHPDIRKKMGQAGRKACERKFTWNNHVRKLLELMDHRSDGRIN